MSAGMTELRAGLRRNLDAVFGGDVQNTGYMLSQPTPPCFEIEPDPGGVNYDMAMGRGSDEWLMIVRGLVSIGLSEQAQQVLDLWLAPAGAGSVKAALEADRQLGGACEDLHVTRVSNYRAFAAAGQPNVLYLGAEWSVRIIARGK